MLVCMIYMFSLSSLMRIDLLVWIVGIPVLIAAVVMFLYQLRQHRQLKEDIDQLSKVKRNTIEYDLVLKAMKLTVWRIDLPTRTITYESDYRESIGMPVLSRGSDVEGFCNTLMPESKAKIAAGMNELAEGKIDEYHEQYEMLLPNSDQHAWGELFATIDKRDKNGKPLSIVGTSMIINRQKEIEKALIEARNKAEESDRLKSAFLANMSHEIRTPLNAIVGFSDVLLMAQSDEERKKLIGLIKKNNAQLLRLFENMTNMAKLEAGNVAVKKARFELNQLLTDLAGRYAAERDRKGLKFQVETMSESPVLYTDRARLREILNQYLNNAFKFTDKGSVTVGYDVRDSLLRIWVRDTGRGIPAKYCNERLFERFVKVDDFVQGTGLGLSICRSLAESISGRVGVESKEGEGTLFWVEISME